MKLNNIIFYHSRKSSLFLAVAFAIFFVPTIFYTYHFSRDLIMAREIDSFKQVLTIIFLTLFPVILTFFFLKKAIKNFYNRKPICTLTNSEIIYAAFYKKSVETKKIQLRDIKAVAIEKTFFGEPQLKIKVQNQIITMNYLNSFMSKSDLMRLKIELNNRITTANRDLATYRV